MSTDTSTTCPACGADWLADPIAHLGVDVLHLRDGVREAVLVPCCDYTQQAVLEDGYRAVYGQTLAATLLELGCDPATVQTWKIEREQPQLRAGDRLGARRCPVPDQPLRLLAPTAVRIGRSTPRPGSWLSGGPRKTESARERMGYGQPTHLDYPTGASFYSSERNLMPSQLWRLYRTTPDVRACVDSITRRIATWDWSVRPTVDPRQRARYDQLAERCAEATAWLAQPNANGETWQELLTRTAIDLLVYDAGVLELNTERGQLLELVPWLGSEWFPVYDEKNVLQGYRQEKEEGAQYPTGTGAVVQVPPERLVYFSLFPETTVSRWACR